MIFVNGKIRRNSQPIETGLTPTSGAFCALPKVSVRNCPGCGSKFCDPQNPSATHCDTCRSKNKFEQMVSDQKQTDSLNSANHRTRR